MHKNFLISNLLMIIFIIGCTQEIEKTSLNPNDKNKITGCDEGKTLVNGKCLDNCVNGTVNPPICDACLSTQTFVSGQCVDNCTNGANNPPACNAYSPCVNGATNPPDCNMFVPCANGANNPPECNTYPPCTNGANNPPACNAYSPCVNGASNPPDCNMFVPCANGANNPPECNTYPPCTNGANNPPTCNTYPPCTNGANNPPECNTYPPCTNGANNPPTCNTYPPCTNGANNPPACNTYPTCTNCANNPRINNLCKSSKFIPTTYVLGTNNNLIPSINVVHTTGVAPFTVLFNAYTSEGDISRYEWDFVDTSSQTNQTLPICYPRYDHGVMAGHRFDAPGSYNVKLTVFDENEFSNTTTIQINVLENIACSSAQCGTGKTGRIYYVANSNNASDNNNGLSESSPWRTIDKVIAEAQSIPAGSFILFKRGDIFNYNNNLYLDALLRPAPYYITIGAYGNSNASKPVIDSSGHIYSGTDKTNTDQGLIIDGLEFKKHFYTISKKILPGNQIIIRNSNMMRFFSYSYQKGIVLENTIINKNFDTDGDNALGLYKGRNIPMFYANGIEVKNSYWHCIYMAEGAKDVLIENSDIHDCGRYEGYSTRDAFTTHGLAENIVLRRSHIHHNGYAIGWDAAYDYDEPDGRPEIIKNSIIEENYIYDHKYYVFQLSALDNVVIRNNLIFNNNKDGNDPTVVKLLNTHSFSIAAESKNVHIVNNTFYNRGLVFNIQDKVGTVSIHNNIIFGQQSSSGILTDSRTTTALNISHNTYFGTFSLSPFRYLNSTITMNSWIQNHETELNADPSFLDIGELNNSIMAEETLNTADPDFLDISTASLSYATGIALDNNFVDFYSLPRQSIYKRGAK